MDHVLSLVILLFIAVIFVGVAQKIRVPYPIALVFGGAAIGFIPNVHPMNFDPTLLLFIFLPPILYYSAFEISFREFKKNWKEIFSLALGLVIVTTVVVGCIFKALFPQYSWSLAFAFGAIVSPPDAISATTILKRFSFSSELLTILEGESLINDASALILYRFAVISLLAGSFSYFDGSVEFFKIVLGGVIVGLILGVLFQRFSKNFLDPIVAILFSFTIPYLTYIFADKLEVSGVLAVVVNGLIGAKIILIHHSSLRRVLGYAAWDIFIILLNCFVFILIGLQLRTITQTFSLNQMLLYSFYGILITFTMIGVRMLWVYARSAIIYCIATKHSKKTRNFSNILRNATIIGWSGMRGIVSLTAALALPYTFPNGELLEGRNEVVFITFVVILLTLVIPGFTLSYLIKKLKIRTHSELRQLIQVRKKLVKAAELKIASLFKSEKMNDQEFKFFNSYFKLQNRMLTISSSNHKKSQELESVRLQIIQAQRQKLLNLWERFEINDRQLSRLEQELDIFEVSSARAKLK